MVRLLIYLCEDCIDLENLWKIMLRSLYRP